MNTPHADERKDVRRARRIADAFEPSDQLEQMAQLAESGHPMTPAQRIAAGMYRSQQQIARAHGKDVA